MIQKQLEDQYFSDLAQKAKQQEIEEIIQKREQRFNKAMSMKADWDMNINLNKLIKEVEQNPRDFYDKVEGDKKLVKKHSDIFANKTTRPQGNSKITEYLRSIDQEHLDLEKRLMKKDGSTIENFEHLISKVSRDIDKKSTYSRKLENQFHKMQQKQASKNRKLLQADSQERFNTKESAEKTQRLRPKQINPLINMNRERKKQSGENEDDQTSMAKTTNIDTENQLKEQSKGQPSKMHDQQQFMATGQGMKNLEDVKTSTVNPIKNVFQRLSAVAKKKNRTAAK